MTSLANSGRFCAGVRPCELELGTTWPTQAQTTEPKDTFEVCKQHLQPRYQTKFWREHASNPISSRHGVVKDEPEVGSCDMRNLMRPF